MIPGILSAILGGNPLPSLSFVGSAEDGTDTNVYTFVAQGTGAAGNRKTIIGVAGRDNASDFSISSVTVGGSAATEIIDSANASSAVQTGLYIIDNPSGTTATVVVTFSEAIVGCAIAVWAAYDLASSVAVDTGVAFDSGAASINMSLDVSAGGIAVGISCTAENQTVSWTGLTERVDSQIAAENSAFSAADITSVAGSAPLTVTADWAGAGDSIGVTASFR